MREWWRKAAALGRRRAIDAEVAEEVRTHLQMKAADTEDPQAARRQFGNVSQVLEDARAAWGWRWVDAWLRDLRYAIRGVMRQPAFAATVVLTLAVGIGASSTIFSLVETVLIRALPYPDSERLVALHEAKPGDALNRTPVAPGRLEDWQALTRSFAGIAGSNMEPLVETTVSGPERLAGAFVSPRFFSVIGVQPALGRAFTGDEERFGGPLAAIISDGMWRRRFGASRDVLGRTLLLTGRNHVIAGVMPPGFGYPAAEVEVWIPKQASPALLAVREARSYNSIGRLKPGATLEQAQADLASVQTILGERYPKTDAGWGAVIVPLKEEMVGDVRLALWLLFGSVSLLLLIACANVACLLLARLNSRGVEIATRYSLGAGRGAIARQLLAEGLVYSLVGGALGLGGLLAGMDVLRKRLSSVPRIGELSAGGSMLAVVVGISVVAALLFSLGPILQTLHVRSTAALIRAGRGLAGTRQRLPRILVSAQLALATALLIGAGLFLRSLIRVQEQPLGFQPAGVLALRVTATSGETADAVVERHARMLRAVSSLPGVTAAAMASGLPGVDSTWPREFDIAGEPAPGGTLRFARWRIVTADYFRVLGLPILQGQSCRMSTDPKRPFEALVNRAFAMRYFAGRDPLGRTITAGPIGDTTIRIVGVAADAREDGPSSDAVPLIYACGYLRYWPDSEVLIRTGNPEALAGSVRSALSAVDPQRPVYSVRTLSEALRDGLSRTRFHTALVTLFSVLALMLAAIGLYGVMAYMVSQRRREIGIRMALGARPAQVVGEVLRSGGMLVGIGALAGVVLAAVVSRLLGALLYGIRASDIASYVSAVAVLVAVALFACLIPGKRAASVYPTEALREQ